MTAASPAAARLGRRIEAERRRRGWSVEDLVTKSGINRTIIYNLEHARQGCTLDSAASLAAALEITLDGLSGPCGRCQDSPPPGFSCGSCGVHGEERRQ